MNAALQGLIYIHIPCRCYDLKYQQAADCGFYSLINVLTFAAT